MKKFETIVRESTIQLHIDSESHEFSISDETGKYDFHTQANGRRLLRIGPKLYKIDNIHFDNHTVTFTLNGRWCTVEVRDERDLLLDEMGFKTTAEIGEGELKAPMPGKILEIMVHEGDEVELDDPVAILEAMKMENELKAPVSGTVTSIAASVGDSLEKNATILEIEPNG